MRLIDADALLDEICDLMHKYENVNFGYRVIMAIHNTPTIVPSADTKSCGVSADKSAEQNVENVPSGDVNKVQTSAEQSEVDFRTDKSANIGTKINHENVQKLHNDNLDKCNDLISRAEGIETVQSYLNILINSRRHGDDFTFINVLTDIRNKISALPSADVVSREDYHNLLMASNDIDRALREYQAKEEADADRPKGANLINRHDATTVIREECLKCNNLTNADLLGRILALPTSQQTDCTDFIMWLIEVVLDEENWEMNAVADGEIIARKLKEFGLLEVKDGYYVRTSLTYGLQNEELVRCKDCIHRQTYKCPMYNEEWYTIDEGDGYLEDDWVVHDYTFDDGFCYLGDTEDLYERTTEQLEHDIRFEPTYNQDDGSM